MCDKKCLKTGVHFTLCHHYATMPAAVPKQVFGPYAQD
jgi:hypothetical protein